MRPPKTIWITVSIVVAGLVGIMWWKSGLPEHPENLQPAAAREKPRHSEPTSSRETLASALSRLDGKAGPTGARQSLKDLQAALLAMPPEEALAWIREYLASGKDQPTGLSFEIGTCGTLTEWPTFRTFLLDALPAIDPETAAALSRKILTAPTTADEWALALRNVGRFETSAEANAYLIERTETLIANPEWQADPSVGYLNAFDVLVHTNATASTPLLSGLIQQKNRKDLAHAAFLALDRLVQHSPTVILPQLAADTALRQSRPEMVAQQFARADLRDEPQRGIVKSWLLDPTRTGTELRSFAAVYPNNNRFISNNLLTTETQQSGAEIAEHDRHALEILKSWAGDPDFEPIADPLRAMTARLTGFVGTIQAPTASSSSPAE